MGLSPPATVLLCEDSEELRIVMRVSLERDNDIRVIAEAGDGPSAVELASRERPEVIVLDLKVPGMDGHELLQRLRAVTPGAGVVLYSGERPSAMVALANEFSDVFAVSKTAPPGELREAVRAAARSSRGANAR
jgi:DNA-binding NarL/FixJ family response regulator